MARVSWRPSPEELRQLFEYDPQTGFVTRRMHRGSRAQKGTVVGNLAGAGYLTVSLGGHRFILHRLIWAHVHGRYPTREIDHINGCKTDNRLSNLREVTRSQNQHNISRRINASGVIGVRYHGVRTRPWTARITVEGKEIYLGSFATLDQACAARTAAKARYHPTAPKA